jgi:anaerobic dimethyl sulfoxide reductase subunit A
MIIAAVTGNIGLPGTCCGSALGGIPNHGLPVPAVDWRRSPPTYKAPIALRSHKLSDAILLKEELEAGRLTEDEYRRRIGAPPDAPLTATRVVSGTSLVSMPDINKQLRALEKVDFTFNLTTNIPTLIRWQIILPMADFLTAQGFAFPHTNFNYFVFI